MLDFTKELCPDRPLIHPTSQTKNCRFGRYVEIGDHCVLEETEVGDYTYCFGSNDIIYTALGKFNSIATGVRINRCSTRPKSGRRPTTLPTAAPTTGWGRMTRL